MSINALHPIARRRAPAERRRWAQAMERPTYLSGDEVRLNDVVELGGGTGPKGRVVVIVSAREAVEGFEPSERAYLNAGVMFEEKTMFGVLHAEELDEEFILISRAQQSVEPDRREDAAPG